MDDKLIVNKVRKKERDAKRYLANKEKFQAQHKQYYADHMDEQQQKIRCDCGQVVAKYALSHHLRSIGHKNWLSDGCFKKFTIVDDEVNKHLKIQYRDKDGNHKSITKRYLRCGYDAAYEAIVAKQAELILEYGTQ